MVIAPDKMNHKCRYKVDLSIEVSSECGLFYAFALHVPFVSIFTVWRCGACAAGLFFCVGVQNNLQIQTLYKTPLVI